MPNEIALLDNYLVVGALLFAIGMIGFLSRRNMIVMFLSAEIMLQGVSVSLVAWSRFHNDFGGQMLVIFIIAVAACEAALALAIILRCSPAAARSTSSTGNCSARPTSRCFESEPLPEPPADRRRALAPLASGRRATGDLAKRRTIGRWYKEGPGTRGEGQRSKFEN